MKKRGFSLIELIVVVALMSIISLVALLKFNILNKIKAKNEVNLLINDLYYAKERALASGQDVRVKFKDDKYYISFHNNIREPELQIERTLSFLVLKVSHEVENDTRNFEFKATGSVANAQRIAFTCKDLYGNEGELIIYIGVAGGSLRIEEKKQ